MNTIAIGNFTKKETGYLYGFVWRSKLFLKFFFFVFCNFKLLKKKSMERLLAGTIAQILASSRLNVQFYSFV